MVKDLVDNDRILDAGNGLDSAVAFAASLNINVEDAFQTLRPTSTASPMKKSNGSKITCMVPSRKGVGSWQRTLPLGVSYNRFSDIAGRLM